MKKNIPILILTLTLLSLAACRATPDAGVPNDAQSHTPPTTSNTSAPSVSSTSLPSPTPSPNLTRTARWVQATSARETIYVQLSKTAAVPSLTPTPTLSQADIEATFTGHYSDTSTPYPTLAPISTAQGEIDTYGVSASEMIRLADQDLSSYSTFSMRKSAERYVWYEGASFVNYVIFSQDCQFNAPDEVYCSHVRTWKYIHFMTHEITDSESTTWESYFLGDSSWQKDEGEDWRECDCQPPDGEMIDSFTFGCFPERSRYAVPEDYQDPYADVRSYFIEPFQYLTQKQFSTENSSYRARIVFSIDPYQYNRDVYNQDFDAITLLFGRGTILINPSTRQHIEATMQLIFLLPDEDDSYGRNFHVEINDTTRYFDFNQPFTAPDVD